MIWSGVILFCFFFGKRLSAESIAAWFPSELLPLAILLLFAFKSVTIVLYAGLLYTASGILFPLPIAMLLNLLGSFIMVTIPYCIGRKTGSSAVRALLAKYPKLRTIHTMQLRNDFLFAYLTRMASLPSDILSLYMGAVGIRYSKYLCGSLAGLVPQMLLYPMLGTNLGQVGSPRFFGALLGIVLYTAVTTIFCIRYRKRHPAAQEPGEINHSTQR